MFSVTLTDIDLPLRPRDTTEQDVDAGAPFRNLARNELLFETGDLKTDIYRVETGALCIFTKRPNLTTEVIEFALAGDLVGMGFLERHATSARAAVDTKVKCFPRDAMERLTGDDVRAKARLDDAVQREFAFRRDRLVNAGRARPLVRLAAFLIAVSHRNGEEGRDPMLIDDTLNCAVVADYLGVSIDMLALLLVQLETRGLVRPASKYDLRIVDLDRLEALASESSQALLQSDLPNSPPALR
jgi:CRP/FNR family transcriptional regulator